MIDFVLGVVLIVHILVAAGLLSNSMGFLKTLTP